MLPLAPDRLTKGDVSGGAPYGVVLPDACADASFVRDGVALPFVSYLNEVFRNGGFPGPVTTDEEWRLKRSLAEGLLPL